MAVVTWAGSCSGDWAPDGAGVWGEVVAMTYRVRVWRESTVDRSAEAVEGAFTAGRSLAESERNIRESVAVSLDVSRSAEDSMAVRLE